MSIVLLTTFIILLLMSVPISVSLGLAATIALIVGDIPVMMLAQRMIASITITASNSTNVNPLSIFIIPLLCYI